MTNSEEKMQMNAGAVLVSILALFSTTNANAVTVIPSDYMIAGTVGDTWDYVRLNSFPFTLTLSVVAAGPNAGRFERGNIDTGMVYDQAGNVLSIYELDKNPLPFPLVIGETELGEVFTYNDEPINPSMYLFLKVPSVTVQAGTFDDVLAMIWLDAAFDANMMNTLLGLDPLITAGVTDINLFAFGVGEIQYIGIDASNGTSDGLGYELASGDSHAAFVWQLDSLVATGDVVFSDEFDDGIVNVPPTSSLQTFFGTVSEWGGHLLFSDADGAHLDVDPFMGVPGTLIDAVYLLSTIPDNGTGTTWTGSFIPNLSAITTLPIYSGYGIQINNATAFGPTSPFFGQANLGVVSDGAGNAIVGLLDHHFDQIDFAVISGTSGNIVLSLQADPINDLVSASYSLDGGSSFTALTGAVTIPDDLTAWAWGQVTPTPVIEPNLPTTFSIPNFGGGGDAEVAFVSESGGTTTAKVMDLGNAAVLNTAIFTSGRDPIDAQLGTDMNGNGIGEIMGLFWDPAASAPVVEAREPVNGKKRRKIPYNVNHTPIALGITGSQSEEGVVLAKQTTADNRGRLLIKNLNTRDTRINITLPKKFSVEDLVMAPDFTGNGFDEALIRATRINDDRGFVLVYDTGGDGRINFLPIPSGQTIIDYDYLVGPGAVSAVTVLALRASDNRPRLYVFDVRTDARLWVTKIQLGWTPVAVRSYETSGGAGRIAALLIRDSDQKPVVWTFNVNTGALIQKVQFDPGQTPVDLTIFPDTSLDGNTEPELGVTMDDGTIKIRDSVSKALLQTLNAP